jgi:hypothetical protein
MPETKPYFYISAEVKIDSVKPGSVGPDGFPNELDPWNLINAVLEQAAGIHSGGAGTGFGYRDLSWHFNKEQENSLELSRTLFNRLTGAMEKMGWHGRVSVTEVVGKQRNDLWVRKFPQEN